MTNYVDGNGDWDEERNHVPKLCKYCKEAGNNAEGSKTIGMKSSNRIVKSDAPDHARELATRRIMPLLLGFRLMDFDLQTLLRSCYLQGVEDAVNLLMKKPHIIMDRQESGGEYQI